METRRDWQLIVFTGFLCILVGLFGFWVASGDAPSSLWSSTVFPALMLVMGCVNLFVAWRRRHRTFDR